jgi:hypothetical protein
MHAILPYMAEVVISFAGEANSGGYGDKYAFKPCLWARRGEVDILRAWIELDGMIGEVILVQLQQLGFTDPDVMIKKAMLRYGMQRFEPLIKELLASGSVSGIVSPTWILGREDKQILLHLATAKTCEYQARVRRDLFCTIPAINDGTASALVSGRPAAPTSRSVCNDCDLPDTDYICSHLLHPATTGVLTVGSYDRQVSQVLCDHGREEVSNYMNCRLGGHSCAQRLLELETVSTTPQLSALGVPESFDVLDAHWRLAFGRTRRLVMLSTVTGPSTLSLGCTTRTEFESRLSALADVLDRLSVDDDLLPSELPVGQETGSLNRLEASLKHHLPPERHVSIGRAIQTLRRIRQARNAVQHGMAEGGLTERLAALGITDAPPNWAGAWDAIRSATVDALTTVRQELRWWIDSAGT